MNTGSVVFWLTNITDNGCQSKNRFMYVQFCQQYATI